MPTPSTTNPRSRALTALVTGLATAAYYAVPDVVRSRAARGWLKAGCLAAAVAVSVPTAREGWQEARTAWRDAVAEDDTADAPGTADSPDAPSPDAPGPVSPARQAALGAAGAAALVASVAATVAGERWVFRRGEALAAAGVPFAHTRTGLVLGAVAAALALVPEPSDRP